MGSAGLSRSSGFRVCRTQVGGRVVAKFVGNSRILAVVGNANLSQW